MNTILSPCEKEVGSRVTDNYIAVKSPCSVKEIMRSLVTQAAENDNVQKIFVLDDDGRFCGAIDLRDLIVAREGQPLDGLIEKSYPYFFETTLMDACAEEMRGYTEDFVPVLDEEFHVIGVITARDIAEAMEEAAAEDYAMLAGLTESEDLKERLLKSIRKRIPWLLVLLVLGLIVSAVIQSFQMFIPDSLIIIYTFQSLILGMSGNVGTQSLAVTIRVLSDGACAQTKRSSLVLKELRVGLCNGGLVGAVAFIAVGGYLQLFLPADMASVGVSGFLLSGCIGLSLLIAMTVAAVSGTFIPILFETLGMDPAVASGPLITTLNDLVAVCTYYGLSILFFVILV